MYINTMYMCTHTNVHVYIYNMHVHVYIQCTCTCGYMQCSCVHIQRSCFISEAIMCLHDLMEANHAQYFKHIY